ncbi:hypothetical protein BH23PAT1_BH23PAT1_1540 [soil metagenome]
MALFQRKPQTESINLRYTLGLNKTLLLVGLGNPGKKYEGTRHNIGFQCLDRYVIDTELGDEWIAKKDLKCLYTSGTQGESKVIVIKPATFMNLSGEAVAATMRFYKIPIENVLVIHDELDIPFGQIRTRIGGSSAGHKGIESILQHCGEGFSRVRIGVKAESPLDGADFVLAKFSSEEQKHLPMLTKEAVAIISEYVYGSGKLLAETRNFMV